MRKYVFIFGGLGNQLFQYSLAVYLRDEFVSDVVLIDCTSGFNSKRRFHLVNGGFETFICPWPISLGARLILKFFYTYFRKLLCNMGSIYYETGLTCGFDELKLRNSKFYWGYWQNIKFAKYSKTAVKNLLNLNPSASPSNMKLGVHIRRGDFVQRKKSSQHDVTSPYYFNKAISKISGYFNGHNYDVILFSDDPEWCKANIFDIDGAYINGSSTDELADFVSLCQCNHFVISNSTFSWWASFLSDYNHKVVVLPRYWLRGIETRSTDLLDPRYHLIQ